jgi:hypothetical protein
MLTADHSHEEQAMVVVRRSVTVVAALALTALAACATRGNLTNAAVNLEYNANALVRDAGDELARTDDTAYPRASEYPRDYGRDAHALARGAHELRLAVEEGASDSEVRAVFARVSRSYHAVRDEVAHSESLRARRDLAPVTDSYRAVEHELGIHPGRDEYLPPA